jgi:hypothetical protein
MTGTKHDKDKPDFTLLPWGAIRSIVKVLDFGKQKYSHDNWKIVPDAKNRYLAAAFRHITAYAEGQTHDEDSGLHHLSHACCCLLFILHFDKEGKG